MPIRMAVPPPKPRADPNTYLSDVLSGNDQEMAEPRRLEVTGEPGVQARIVAERQPEQQPGLGLGEQPVNRASHERSEALRRTDEQVRRGAQASDLARRDLDGDPP